MTEDVFRVALSGGIASGKTTIADLFAEHGAVLIDTDIIAREVVEPGSPGLAAIVQAFDEGVLSASGDLDRQTLRQIVFADDEQRHKLESIVHPLIRSTTLQRMQTLGGPYQIIVVPLLVESPLKDVVDRVLIVDCDEKTQMERLQARDAESQEQALRMIAAQSTRAERLAIADDVIHNDGSLDQAMRQVDELHARYLSLASSARESS